MNETTHKITERAEEARDIAYKIWLAGVGAYGRAFTEAAKGVEQVNESAGEFFEDLVKRGEEIEHEVRERISHNEQVSKSRKRVGKVMEAAADFQEKQRERFEARMDRMRSVLGMPRPADNRVAELEQKIEALSAQIATLSGASKPAAKKTVAKKAAPAAKAASLSPADRIRALAAEIGGVEETSIPAKKPAAKRAAPKKTTAAKKPAAKKAPARKPAAKKATA